MRIGYGMMMAVLLAVSAVAANGADWVTDFEAAKARAAEENRHMLLNFSGSDWCGWCIRLDKEVFEHDAFKEYAANNLVTVVLDFPRKTQLPANLRKQNEALMKQYGVRGFPTIILLDPQGNKVAQTGYRQGGPESYVRHLQALINPEGVSADP